jgi:hypothetical protein
MKVFIGLSDIASQISQYKKGFLYNSIDCVTAVHSTTQRNLKENYDYIINKDKIESNSIIYRLKRKISTKYIKSIIWKKALRDCDTFIFLWSTFQTDYQDIRRLKNYGKKVIVIFVGSDIRWNNAMRQEFAMHGIYPMEYSNYDESSKSLEKKLLYLRTAEKYADRIYSIPNQSQLSLRPYHLFKYPINIEDYTENTVQREFNPIVIHAPSYREVKGTKYIVDAVDKLKSEGLLFEFKLLENIPFRDVLQYYTDGDIMVGQILAPGGGKQEREGLASGMVVLSNMSYLKYPQKIASDCPIVDVNRDNIYAVLKTVIQDYKLRSELSLRGRSWVEKEHNVNFLVNDIVNNLISDDNSYDFMPVFYRNHYKPSSHEVDVLNRYNQLVKSEQWYSDYVQPGRRDGLVF